MARRRHFYNGRIYSMEREGDVFGSMSVRGGRIEKLWRDGFCGGGRGRDRAGDFRPRKGDVDLGGRAVIPGLIDCHSHFVASGAMRPISVNVSEIEGDRLVPENFGALRRKLVSAAGTGGRGRRGGLLLCTNYIIPSFDENRLPTSAELDEWLGGREVVVLSMDGHSSSYSSSALEAVGIADQARDGVLEGEAHEFNMGRVNSYLMKQISPGRLLRGIAENVNDAADSGLCGIHCLEGFEDDPADPSLRILSLLAGGIPQRLTLFPEYMDLSRIEPYKRRMRRLRVGGCGSWEMDGSVSSHSAAFFSDYIDKPGCRGSLYYTQDEVDRAVAEADAGGYQIAVHAIGTAAIGRILSAFEKLPGGRERIRLMRHRIEHFEFPTADHLRRAAELGVSITVQPGFAWMDEKFQRSYRKYLSDGQRLSQVAMRDFIEAGGILCGGSDSPVQAQNPFIQIHGMVNFPIADQRISVYEAVKSYCVNAAWLGFDEAVRGSLAEGKAADFLIMADGSDPFLMDGGRLIDAKVDSCYIAGVDRIAKRLGTAGLVAGAFFKRKTL